MAADPAQIAARVRALQTSGRLDEAVEAARGLVDLLPSHPGAEQTLAAALLGASRWSEAKERLDFAVAKGGDSPEIWVLRARCLQELQDHGAADEAYRQAIRRRPSTYDAHRSLAQLRWMRTGDIAYSLVELEQAMSAMPNDANLGLLKAEALGHADRSREACDLLRAMAAQHPTNAAVSLAAAQACQAAGEDGDALSFAERTFAAAPDEPLAAVTLIETCLALGDIDRADDLAGGLRARLPENQHAIALQAVAWRLKGDPRYRDLYDYANFVGAYEIEPPAGWADLSAYLAEVRAALLEAHAYQTHPFSQSIRHGSQVSNVQNIENKALKALPQAFDDAIRRHIAAIGVGDDPLRSRNRGGYAIKGMWSIRMGPGGFHTNHVHPQGWLSSACYIDTPKVLRGREGVIQFGKPGPRTKPPLEAEHFVEPKPGRLVLFPAYMWHGTVPFADPSMRLTIAFDVVAAGH